MKTLDVYNIFDIQIDYAKGSYVWDNKGQHYLDLYGGHAVISIGHGHPHFVKKLKEQLDKISFYSNSIKIPLQDQLAEKLGSVSRYEDYNLFLCNSGAEANENALKLASFHNERKKIIAFKGAFHGRTSLAVSVTDNPKISARINQHADIAFLPLNDFEAIERAINKETCAVIIEGIQGVAGIHVPEIVFLEKLSELCKKNGALLILDEVQSGFGRTGKFFAHQYSNIRPDMITVAKGMGNGFPVGGVLISPEIESKKEMLGTTFGGNHLACSAALAVLETIEEEKLLQNAEEMGTYLKVKLQALPGIKEIRGTGLMLGIQVHENGAEIRRQLLFDKHIFTGASSDQNTIRILPALGIKQEELDTFIEAFQEVLIAVSIEKA